MTQSSAKRKDFSNVTKFQGTQTESSELKIHLHFPIIDNIFNYKLSFNSFFIHVSHLVFDYDQFSKYEALPGVLGIQGEGLFIFRDLGRRVIYFQGFGEKAEF